MALGLGILRLEPRAFWSLTPREFSAAARAVLGPATSTTERPSRTSLAALMSQFPDRDA